MSYNTDTPPLKDLSLRDVGKVDPMTTEEFWKIAKDHLVDLKFDWLNFIPVRAEGAVLYDKDGREMLDFTSGQMSSLLGHGHSEITHAIIESAQRLDHLFSAMLSAPVIRLCQNLTALLPLELSKFIFLSTGSDVVECSLKMAKMYTGKWEVVSFATGYHGMSGGSASATFVAGRHSYGPLLPGHFLLPVPDPLISPFVTSQGVHEWQKEMDFGWKLIDQQSTGNLAVCIVEPILSIGGMVELPEGYLEKLKEECEKRGMLLIVDEAQTGIGRTGDMFAYQHSTIIPDFLLLSKTLGGGQPLSAVCTSPKISEVLKKKGFLYNTTHQNEPIVCAVGSKICEIALRDNLPKIGREKGKILKDGFVKLKDRYSFITRIGGRGMMLGITLKTTEIGFALSSRAFELGLQCNFVVPVKELGGTIRIVPPMTVTLEEIERGLGILEEACAWVEKTVLFKV